MGRVSGGCGCAVFCRTGNRNRQKSILDRVGHLAVAALLCGAALSWFASAYPDGLEWSVAGVTGSEEARLAEPSPLHQSLETVQAATAIMPDYAFPAGDEANTAETESASSIVNPETSMAGRSREGCALLMKMTMAAVASPSTAPMAR